MMMISYLSPETIKDINLDEEEQADDEEKVGEEEEEQESAATVCLSADCTTFISGRSFLWL